MCQVNLRHIAMAWDSYLNDHNDSFYKRVNANVNYGGWRGMVQWYPRPLNGYMNIPNDLETEEGGEVFHCPDDDGGVPGFACHTPAYEYIGTSYQTNILLIGQSQIAVADNPRKPLHEAINLRIRHLKRGAIEDPSRMLLIGEYGWVNEWMPGVDWPKDWHDRPHHHNLAFLDGHVEFLHVRKGLYVTHQYRVQPFRQLDSLAYEVQQEEVPHD